MSSSEPILEVRALATAYAGRPVLRAIRFDLARGEILALLGPNGSGKTTLLRALAGLEPVTAGEVRMDAAPITDRPTHRRGIGFLFQEPAMLPGRTVAENVAYGLDIARWPRARAEARIAELLDRLELEPLAHRPADALSGGERQRVALARTLAPQPQVVLLDEPLASVDPELRGALREQFGSVLRAEGTAAIYVTHDPEEALAIGDRILLLRDGSVAQLGLAADVVRAPVDAEAARFLGYQLLPAPTGVTAVLPRELEVAAASDALWTGTVEAGRPGLGEAVRWVRVSPSVRIEWRSSPAVAAQFPPGSTVGLRPLHPLAYCAPRTPGPPGPGPVGPGGEGDGGAPRRRRTA